jgi:hypothetical protein
MRWLCQAAGVKYVMDWYSDDQPFYLSGKDGGKLLNIPCSQDLGDMPAILAHDATPAAYADMLIDAFEEMRRQASKHPQQLVFSVPLRESATFQARMLRCFDCVFLASVQIPSLRVSR